MSDESVSRAGRCLSDGQLLALQSMAPEQIPGDVVAHLASCERCQRLALFGPPQAGERRVRNPPSLRRAFLLVGIILAALAVFLFSLRMLLG